MSTYNIVDPVIGAQAITARSTTAKHDLWTCVKAKDTASSHGIAEFVYVKGVASAEAFEWATLDFDAGNVVRLAANAKGKVGVLMSTLTASYYGWAQVAGHCDQAQCLTQFADNGNVYATGTAGAIDDASVAGDLIIGAVGASATVADSGVAEFDLDHPYIIDKLP